LFVGVGVLISLLVGQLRESRASIARARDTLRRQAQLVDLSHDAIMTADSNRRITGWNAGAAEMYGWTESEALGKVLHDFLHTSLDGTTTAIDESLHREGRWDGELSHLTRDGRRLVLESRQVLLRDDRSEPVGILEIDRDVTARKQAEEKLRRYSAELAEINDELTRFTQIVSHDLRAPVVSLKGFSADLRDSIDTLLKPGEDLLASLPEPQRAAVAEALQEAIPEALSFIENAATRMDHLIGALIRLSRVGYREFHMEELDAGALMRDTARALAHQIERSHIAVEIGPLPRIVSDRAAIEQVFGNLLDNAIKYLDPQRPGHIDVSAEEMADAVIFHVRDNGRGIAQEEMHKVFEPFRRAGAEDVPGEGMGLAFVRALLHRLGGKIECQSQPGAGTTFSFTLPRSGREKDGELFAKGPEKACHFAS
jgi:PAS domain S-box-containing protein